MSPSATIRFQARQVLKGNYVKAVAAFMILLLPVYITIGLTCIVDGVLLLISKDAIFVGVMEIIILTPINIVVAVLLSPLFNGFVRCFYLAGVSGVFRPAELFYYFEKGKYHRALMLNLSFLVRIMLPAIICYLPFFLYQIFCYTFLREFTDTVLYNDFAFILAILSAILLILYAMKYFVVFVLFCADDTADTRELFQASKSVMMSNKTNATKLIFSFTPWLMLCLLVIPALYVVPYMTQSLCIGAKWMTMKGY